VKIGISADGKTLYYKFDGCYGYEVYAVDAYGLQHDSFGIPLGLRWECDFGHWKSNRRTVYADVLDVA